SAHGAQIAQRLRDQLPERYELLDKNSVREYRYVRGGKETLKTPFGDVPTVIYRSHRANSPHVNRYWCAPGRGYIPIRVEQKRGDDVQWIMEIRSLKREGADLPGSAADSNGLRVFAASLPSVPGSCRRGPCMTSVSS